MRSKITLLLALASLLACVPAAQASIVVMDSGGWQVTTADPNNAYNHNDVSIAYHDPFRDNAGNLCQVIQIFKIFRQAPDPLAGQIEPILLTFTQKESDNETATRIIISDEAITNLTGVAWADYHWDLVAQDTAYFNTQLTNAGKPGGWDISPFTSHEWGSQPGVESLDVSGGGTVGNFDTYYPGVLGGNMVIDIVNLHLSNSAVFNLKQYPTVPEPGSLAFVSLGGLVVMFTKRRKARA